MTDLGANPPTGSPEKGNNRWAIVIIIIPGRGQKREKLRKDKEKLCFLSLSLVFLWFSFGVLWFSFVFDPRDLGFLVVSRFSSPWRPYGPTLWQDSYRIEAPA